MPGSGAFRPQITPRAKKNPDFDKESDTRDRGGKEHITQRHGSRPLLARPLKP